MIAPARQSYDFIAHLRVTWVERALMRYLARRRVPARKIAHAFGRRHMTVLEHVRDVQRKRRKRTNRERRLIAKMRRDELRLEGNCINGAGHGRATHGVRCAGCAETHRRSA